MVKRMKLLYQFIFYRLYRFSVGSERSWGAGPGIPHWVGVISFSILLGFNLLTLFVMLNHYFPFAGALNKFHGIGIAFFLYFVNYLIFIRENRYKGIVKRIDGKGTNKKLFMEVFFWLYIISTFVLFFTVLPMFAPTRH